MPRTHGYAPVGERCVGKHDGHRQRRTNVIGALLASFHKRADFQPLIEQHGHLLEFLPPYSPDLNPIEHKWAQAKALRRQKKMFY